jgi:hypothetical protein
MTKAKAPTKHSVELSADEIRLLLQSIDHCLATCGKKQAGGKARPCEDCGRARRLRQRLAKLA